MKTLEEIQAVDVRRGDVIGWCDRWLVVEAVEGDKRRSYSRPGRLFKVRIDNKVLRLHYFDAEWVTLGDNRSQGESK